MTGCGQVGYRDHRSQPARHRFDDADGFDIRDGAMHEQVAGTMEFWRKTVSIRAVRRRQELKKPPLS